MSINIKLLQVGLEKINVQIVQGVKISIKKFCGNLGVERLFQIMAPFENRGCDTSNAGLVRSLGKVDQVGVILCNKSLIDRIRCVQRKRQEPAKQNRR
jgi:hypothetical protein